MANIIAGDLVTIRIEPRLRSDNNDIYKVEVVKSFNPGSDNPFWVLSRNNDLYVFDTPIVLKKSEAVD